MSHVKKFWYPFVFLERNRVRNQILIFLLNAVPFVLKLAEVMLQYWNDTLYNRFSLQEIFTIFAAK